MLEEVEIACPHCGEPNVIQVDVSAGDTDMVEDCTVCCRPMQVRVRCSGNAVRDVEVAVA